MSNSIAWSIMIPTFNCAKYLEQTLRSILQQNLNFEIFQIEVVDDHSTLDDPEEVVKRVGMGKVLFYRQENNVGAIRNFNTCIERAQGEYIHILHGDDWVGRGFYETMQAAFEKHTDIGICISRYYECDEYNNILRVSSTIPHLTNGSNEVKPLLYWNPIGTPSVAVRKESYKKAGAFSVDLIHVADWEMWIRLIHKTKGLFIDQPLAYYRFFSGNDTSRLVKTGANIYDYIKLGLILENNYTMFNLQSFLVNVEKKAFSQKKRFYKSGEDSCYQANKRAHADVYKMLSIKQRLKLLIKRFLRSSPVNQPVFNGGV